MACNPQQCVVPRGVYALGDSEQVIQKKILQTLNGMTGDGSAAVVYAGLAAWLNSVGMRMTGQLTDRSGAIAVGNVSQLVAGPLTDRRYLIFQNVSDADMWINFTNAATLTQPSFKIVPNGSFVMEAGFVSNEALNVICALAGKAFTCKEF